MQDDAYQNTVARLEPNIAMVDRDAALASIAVSLKRIADLLQEKQDAENGVRYARQYQMPGPYK